MGLRQPLHPISSAPLALSVLSVLSVLMSGCSGALGPLPCTSDGECPTGSYCKPAVGGAPRTCDVAPSSCSAPKPDLCHGACVDSKSDLGNCGTCDNACPTPAGSSPSCVAGSCGFACSSTTAVKVGQTCVDLPGVPSPLSASGGDRVVHLSWTAGANAATTSIRRTPVGGGAAVIVAAAATSTTYDDATVTAGTAWSYVFRAANPAGESADSAAITALTVPAAPANASFAPPVLSGTTAQAVLSWDRVPSATNYTVVRTGTPGETGAAPDTGGSRTLYTTNNLVTGSAYSFTISASNASGPGPVLANVNLVVPPAASPSFSAPTVSTTQVALVWTAAPGATSYKLYRGAIAATASTLLQTITTPAALAFTDTQVTTNAAVGYRLVSSNAGGDGGAATLDLFVPPTAPTGLTATGTGLAIALTWNQVAGVSSYDVLEGTASQCTVGLAGCSVAATVGQPATGTTAGASIGPRAAGTQYFYRVVARTQTAGGSVPSSPSAEVSATTAPATPTVLTAMADASLPTITVTWNRATAALSYDLVETRVDTSTTSTISVTDPPSGPTAQAVRNTLQPGTQYTYSVAARNAAGASAPASVAWATTAGLSAPKNLKVGSSTSTSVTLAWSAVSNAAGYVVFRGSGSPGNEVQIEANQTSTSYLDTSLSPGSTYSYLVAAQVTAGDTTQLGGKAPLLVTLPPATPQQFKLQGTTASSVSLSWFPSGGAVAYSLGVGTAPGNEVLQPDIPDTGSAITYPVPNLLPGTPYYFNVFAKNAGGGSPVSAELTATTLITAPAALTAVTFSDTAVDLTWPRVAGAAQYEMFSCSANCTVAANFISGGRISDTGAATVTGRDAGLAANTNYTFQVISRTAAAQSPPGPQSTALTQLSIPTGFTVTAADDNTAHLVWNQVAGAASYDLWRDWGSGAVFYTNLPASATSTAVFDDRPLTSGRTISYSLVSRSTTNQSPRSAELSVTTPLTNPPFIQLKTIDEKSIKVTFSRLPGFDVYDAFVQFGGGAPSCATSTAPTATVTDAQTLQPTYTIIGSPGTTVFVCARARSTVSTSVSPWSGAFPGSFASSVPVAPGNLFATGAFQGAGRGGLVLLSWMPNPFTGGTPNSYTITRNPGTGQVQFTTANTWFTDLLPSGTAGQSLNYTILATNGCNASPPPSGCSAGGSGPATFPAVTLDPQTFSGSRINNYVTPTADVKAPLQPAPTYTPFDPATPGKFLAALPSVHNADGYFIIAAVPSGRGYFRLNATVVDVNGPGWIDLGADVSGRPDASPSPFEDTTLTLSATNLSPYLSTDVLEFYSPYSNTYAYDLVHNYSSLGLPAVGDTSLNGMFFSWIVNNGYGNYVNGQKGDVALVTQNSTTLVSSKGLPYGSVVRLAQVPSFTQIPGRQTALNVALNTLTPNKSVSVIMKRSAFAQYLTAINPSAQITSSYSGLDTYPGGQAHGNFSGGIDMLSANTDAGTTDLDYGTVTYADPFDTSWYRRGNIGMNFSVSMAMPGFTKPFVIATSLSGNEPQAAFTAEAATGLVPHISPVTSPQITYLDSTGAPTTIPFFTNPLPKLGTNLIVSWFPPALGTPTYYRVRFGRVSDDGSGTPLFSSVFNVNTTATSVPAPPNSFAVGQGSFILITASLDPGRDIVHTPLGSVGQSSTYATAVSYGFTP